MMACETVRQRLELFLDGDLPEAEATGMREHWEACDSCRSWLREDRFLSEALTQWLETAGATRVSTGPAPRRWWFAAWPAAAAAVLVAGFFLIREAIDDRSSPPLPLVARSGAVILADFYPRDVRAGRSMLRVLPGGSVTILESDGACVLALDAGTVDIDAHLGVVSVRELDGSVLFFDGHASVSRTDTAGEPELVVHVYTGNATFERSGEKASVPPGEPVLISARGPVRLVEAARRFEELHGDEELVVMTSEEALEREAAVDVEREQLQRRIGELMAENNRLQLESEALRLRLEQGAELGPRELISALSKQVETLETWTPVHWGRVRAVAVLLRDRKEEAEQAITELLLAPSESRARQRLGLKLLGILRTPGAVGRLLPFVGTDDRELHAAAVEALSWQRGEDARALLEEVFKSETDLTVRVAAAGGLVRLGDSGEPLQWLMHTYERGNPGKDLRRRILGRVLFAPVSATGRFLVGVLTSPDMDEGTHREVLEQLGRIGGRRAEELLDFLGYALEDPDLRAYVRRVMSRMRH